MKSQIIEKTQRKLANNFPDYDYDENELFAVFSKTEIRAMITVLQYALSDCNFPISKFMDTYYLGDIEIYEKELDDWKD